MFAQMFGRFTIKHERLLFEDNNNFKRSCQLSVDNYIEKQNGIFNIVR